jgi:hypothetical protein
MEKTGIARKKQGLQRKNWDYKEKTGITREKLGLKGKTGITGEKFGLQGKTWITKNAAIIINIQTYILKKYNIPFDLSLSC